MIGSMDFTSFRPLVQSALAEDLGELGDVTTDAVFTDEAGELTLLSKADGVLAGSAIFDLVFAEIDPAVVVEWSRHDGDTLRSGEEVATVRGRSRSLLRGERTALNFLSFLSGIATSTRRHVQAAGCGRATVLDTRKTLPGYRALSKYAVRVGGGANHRMGLFDMVMLKDNHIDLAGSITDAIRRVREKWGDRFKVEVECRTRDEMKEAIEAGADVVMLDNMDVASVSALCGEPHEGTKIEVSGNVSIDTLEALAVTGVDYISVGALTHSVRAFDFSLRHRPYEQ